LTETLSEAWMNRFPVARERAKRAVKPTNQDEKVEIAAAKRKCPETVNETVEQYRKRVKLTAQSIHVDIERVVKCGSSKQFTAALAKLKETHAPAIINHTVAKRSMYQGTKFEKQDLARSQIPIKSNNLITYMSTIHETDKFIYVLIGAVDGFHAETGGVVETKHRKSRLFEEVKDYERIQVEVYMHLTDTQDVTATLLENYIGESSSQEIVHDKELWNECMTAFKEIAVMIFEAMC
jgi:23S rRNA pseudoU1915 N3-methylase RlmH